MAKPVMKSSSLVVGALLCALAVNACGPSQAPRGERSAQGAATPGRALEILMRAEPLSLAVNPLQFTGLAIYAATRPFNAQLDIEDAHKNPHPYLADALPQLNTETWRVFPDGRMHTSYRLRPNLKWHDDIPLTAEDFGFAWRVFSTPEYGVATIRPVSVMEEVLAPDEATVVIRWRRLYPDANALKEGFQPLPRHLLEPAHQQRQPDVFVNLPFWTSQYVGLGPYRLERWEPGAFIEGVAFDGHVWGRPRAGRLVIRFTGDENTALANLLAESVHLATNRAIRFEQGVLLQREWDVPEKGTVVLTPTSGRFIQIQFRPEFADPRAVLDVRVRKAVAHAVDKEALNDGLLNGQGVLSDALVRPTASYYPAIDRVITKYPFDLRRTEQFMNEAGFTRGPEGVYVSDAGERFGPQLMNQAGAQPERETTIMIDTWRRAGIDARPNILPVSRLGDVEERAKFPAFQNASGAGVWESELDVFSSEKIGTPQNRWQGLNRGGWSDPEYDRLWAAFNTTLERAERDRQVVQMAKLVSEQVPVIFMFFNFGVSAYRGILRGPDAATVEDTRLPWNIHEWELR